MTKPTTWHVCSANTKTGLGIRPIWSEPSPRAQWVAKGPSLLHLDSKDPDQTGRMPRLICVFTVRACHPVGPHEAAQCIISLLQQTAEVQLRLPIWEPLKNSFTSCSTLSAYLSHWCGIMSVQFALSPKFLDG